jgi:uncharacterized protein (DUF58 family)
MGLLDRAAKRLLEQLHITVRPRATSIGQGAHRSRTRAAGLEFADHRLYTPGDDIRHIDWKAFTRNRQLMLKTFEEEREVYIYILLDASLSMTRGDPPKLDRAKAIAAAFAYLGMKQFDRVRVVPFATELGDIRAGARSKAAYPLIERALEELSAEGVTSFEQTTKDFAERYPRHGLVVVITDLMEARDWGESFRILARLGHELWVVRTSCLEDERPDFRGELELEDVELGRVLTIRMNKAVIEAYGREVRAHIEACHEACDKVGGRFVEAPVELSLDEALRAVLATGARAA